MEALGTYLAGKQNAPDDDPTLYVFKQETVPQLRQVLSSYIIGSRSTHERLNDALIKQFETIVRSDAGVFHLPAATWIYGSPFCALIRDIF